MAMAAENLSAFKTPDTAANKIIARDVSVFYGESQALKGCRTRYRPQ